MEIMSHNKQALSMKVLRIFIRPGWGMYVSPDGLDRGGDLNALPGDCLQESFLTYKYIQWIIQLRKDSPLFCLCECPPTEYVRICIAQEINSPGLMLFNAARGPGPEQILLAINRHFEQARFTILFEKNLLQIADTFLLFHGHRAGD
jgi:hypothetical protein